MILWIMKKVILPELVRTQKIGCLSSSSRAIEVFGAVSVAVLQVAYFGSAAEELGMPIWARLMASIDPARSDMSASSSPDENSSPVVKLIDPPLASEYKVVLPDRSNTGSMVDRVAELDVVVVGEGGIDVEVVAFGLVVGDFGICGADCVRTLWFASALDGASRWPRE
jgi:hypothetical protein